MTTSQQVNYCGRTPCWKYSR